MSRGRADPKQRVQGSAQLRAQGQCPLASPNACCCVKLPVCEGGDCGDGITSATSVTVRYVTCALWAPRSSAAGLLVCALRFPASTMSVIYATRPSLPCAAFTMRLPLPLQVSKRSVHFVSVSRSIRVTVQATQGPSARVHHQCHAHSRNAQRCFALKNDLQSSRADSFISNGDHFATGDRKETFVERFTRAWSVLFPAKSKPSSNKDIAKQRLKMIIVSDRCSVNDEAKKKIVNNIVGALSDFVEIQSEEKVQFDVTSDADLNTVCSVTVPVRRVRPEYQEFSRELVNAELKAFDYEEGEGSFRMVDIRFGRPDVEDIQD